MSNNHLRLVSSNNNNIEKAVKHDFRVNMHDLGYFSYSDFIGPMADTNLAYISNDDSKSNILDHNPRPSEVLKDIYFYGPRVSFSAHKIPLAPSSWRSYFPFLLEATCLHCHQPVRFELWTLKEFNDCTLVTSKKDNIIEYCDFLLANETNKKIPWCRPCIKAKAIQLSGMEPKVAVVRLKDQLLAYLQHQQDEIGIKDAPNMTKSLMSMCDTLAYDQIYYTVTKVMTSVKEGDLPKDQKQIAKQLLRYGKMCRSRNFKIARKHVPVDKETQKLLVSAGISHEDLSAVPVSSLVQL